MSVTEVLSGNEAVSRGFWESGGLVSVSYPGSPTVEILESMKKYNEIEARWAPNEKVAMEIAIGASMAGGRAIVSMKHVGINIASDPFMTFTQVRTNGGFVLLVGDDPGLNSSQNEQDSRVWGRFANIPVLEPSNPQEIKDFIKQGLQLSESFGTPVMVKLTTTLCHGRAAVVIEDRIEKETEGFKEDQARYCMLPPYANGQQYFMKKRMDGLAEYNNEATLNLYEEVKGSDCLIITSGVTYEYLKETQVKASVLKLGMIYPLPIEKIKRVAEKYERVIVIEELLPLMEDNLKAEGLMAEGKKYFPFTGELTTEVIKEGLFNAGLLVEKPEVAVKNISIPGRTPMLCAGCPHRPVFHILKKAKAVVMGDIGCYSLGILEPFEVLKTNISMGASLGIVQGVAAVHRKIEKQQPLVAMIGDGTFFHSGMPGMVELSKTKDNITVIVMDNRTTAMTGGQQTPTTGEYIQDDELHVINIRRVLEAFGITDITVVDQFEYKETRDAILAAMKRDGLSIIITSRPCALGFKVKEPNFYVDSDICISCRSCIGVNCPPISMKQYEGKSKKNSYIDPDMCVGCSICSQVCPVKAIKRSAAEVE